MSLDKKCLFNIGQLSKLNHTQLYFIENNEFFLLKEKVSSKRKTS